MAPAPQSPPAFPPAPAQQEFVRPHRSLLPEPYAGFWLRLVAYFIDSIIASVAVAIVVLVGVAVAGVGALENSFQNGGESDTLPAEVIAGIAILSIAFVAGMWLYYAWMESSVYQGTLGKMALGLIVTGLDGSRITFGRATGRYFSKLITGLIPLGIGYAMAGFTQRKQALHDMIAGCLVLRKT
jgi:uncharacterized RDD family membrane protein YckC